ncbi:MAG TPA: glycine zipper family protein [Burkholderiaceae bacterium]|nr:glycine zipper family protein [Burkholderiaceae bacterium]
MHPLKIGSSLALGAIALTGCAAIPDGPSIAIMPAPTKPFEVFVADDQLCRGWAAQSIGVKVQTAANTSAMQTAAVGTAMGAAAGALIGSNWASAGIGAGTGLVLATAVGMSESSRTSYTLQRRYDIAYAQCMYAKGNILPGQSLGYNNIAPPPHAPPPPQ